LNALENIGSYHPSLGVDIDGFKDLTEPTRRYLLALMVKKHKKDDQEPSPNGESAQLVFGKTKKERKKRRKLSRKRKSFIYGDEIIRASTKRGGLDVSDERVAALRGAAKLALAAAEQVAGEPVCWCCGVLRIKSKIDYECECEKRPEIKQVNELLQE